MYDSQRRDDCRAADRHAHLHDAFRRDPHAVLDHNRRHPQVHRGAHVMRAGREERALRDAHIRADAYQSLVVDPYVDAKPALVTDLEIPWRLHAQWMHETAPCTDLCAEEA